MTARIKQQNRVLQAAVADLEADLWSGRDRAVIHARAHLAAMSPARREQLEKEWEDKA